MSLPAGGVESSAGRGGRCSVGPDFSPGPYISGRSRGRSRFLRVLFGGIELHWPSDRELARIGEWFREPWIHLALGFPIPPSAKHLRLSLVPDLTGGGEPVELLTIADRSSGAAIGFLVVYEPLGLGRAVFELDLAIGDGSLRGAVPPVRHVRTAALGYLFTLRGARRVFWSRRKAVPGRERTLFRWRGRRVEIDRGLFRRTLERIARSQGAAALPVIELERATRSPP